MSNFLKRAKLLSEGVTDPEILNKVETGTDDFSEEFITECMNVALPFMISDEINESYAAEANAALTEAFTELNGYLVGQGLLQEAVNLNNPKINVVRLNKVSQLERLTKIMILKLARKDNNKNYKRFKIGHQMKKISMANMSKQYRMKAERLARELMRRTKNHSKIQTTIDSKKKK